MTRPARSSRHGMSLLEVLVALAILLMALIVLGRLIILGSERARDVQLLAHATQLCQSKMAEVIAGAVPMTAQSATPFDEDPEWTWTLDCNQNEIANLWDVTVTVTRERKEGDKLECALNQKVLDPSLRGSATDASIMLSNAAANSATTAGSSTGSSATTTSGTGSTTGSGGN